MKKPRFEILLFFAYLLLALVVTWPLIAKFNSSIYGLWGDHFGQLWSDWWRKEALLSGKSLFYTPLIDAPFGTAYNVTAFQPLHTALRLGLTLLTNEVLSLNIWLLLSFPLSGLAVHFLVKRLTGNRLAGSFSGLIYAFSMYRFSHAWEHSSLMFTFWMPFYVLALVGFSEKKNIKNAIAAALLFAAVLLDNFYYGYFTFLFTAFFFLFQIRRWLDWRSLRLLFLFFAFCLLFSVPFILPTVRIAVTGNVGGELASQDYQRSLHDVNWFSARPWHYVLPSPWHPLWGRYSRKVLDWIATKPPYFLTQPYSGKEHNLYLGWTALILSAVAVLRRPTLRVDEKTLRVFLRRRRWVLTFLFLGIVMMIFSAPPYATISLHKIYFPSHYLYNFFPMFRCYARFGVLVLLCVSVLAGFGLKVVLEKIKSRRNCFYVFMFLCFLVLLEVLLPPFNVDLTPPEAYRWLAEQSDDFIVMEYPLPTDHTDILYQRAHGKRLFDPRRKGASEFLSPLAEEEKIDFDLLSKSIVEFPNILKELGVNYVILHKDEEDPLKRLEDFVDWDGYKVGAEFTDITVYEVIGK